MDENVLQNSKCRTKNGLKWLKNGVFGVIFSLPNIF